MTDKVSSPVDTLFAKEILSGLRENPKRLPSKYFYDPEGDRLFKAIMEMPEYYLTNCETEIFNTHKNKILQDIAGSKSVDLVELGAGDGSKTRILIEHFTQNDLAFKYFPIDISSNILKELKENLLKKFPKLMVQPLAGEYLSQLQQLAHNPNTRKVLLFLGANIGNLPSAQSREFLNQINSFLDPGDLMLIGFDLKKDPQVILNAYNDPAGITAAFNLNLLDRLNRELGADFDRNYFKHWETYNPITGETKSYLISTQQQTVHFAEPDIDIAFDQWEPIYMELSLKYSLKDIEALAIRSGFRVLKNYTDSRAYFTDSLWIKE